MASFGEMLLIRSIVNKGVSRVFWWAVNSIVCSSFSVARIRDKTDKTR
jgi:hypothetical protein